MVGTEYSLAGKTLLVVKSGSASRREVLEDLLATGVTVVCMNEQVAPWARDLISEWIIDPMVDAKIGLSHVQHWLAEHPLVSFNGVLCYDEYGVSLASQLAAGLGLPWMKPELVETFRNKFKFREWCVENGVASPRFVRLNGAGTEVDTTTPGALVSLMEQAGLTFPVVVKPTGGAGKYHVRIIHDEEALRATIDEFRSKIPAFMSRWVLSRAEAEGLYCEELLTGGPEVDVDCLVQNGKLVWASINENKQQEPPYFQETGGRIPETFDSASRRNMLNLLEDICRAGGESFSGCFHFEAMVTPNGARPIEVNLRLGGAETPLGVKAAFEVRLFSCRGHGMPLFSRTIISPYLCLP
jgi:biotin carboxylase